MSKSVQYDYDRDSFEDIRDNNEPSENTEPNIKFESEQTRFTDHDKNEEEDNNIIPWKKLLRKTNSRITAT
jgi:hypothetical protein